MRSWPRRPVPGSFIIGLIFSWIVLAVVMLPRPAEAGEIPKIKLGQNGPNKALPLRDEFYLTGDVPEGAKRVHVAFVRYRYGPLGIAPRRSGKKNQRRANSCAEVSKALDISTIALGALRPGGVLRIDEVWPRGPKDSKDERHEQYANFYRRLASDPAHSVYVAPEWDKGERKGDDAKTWEILVSNKQFFRPGARYCMFLIEVGDKELPKEQTDALFKRYTTKTASCSRNFDPSANPAALQPYTACLQSALRTAIEALEDGSEPLVLDEDTKKAAIAAIMGSSDAALSTIDTVVHAQKRLQELVPTWKDYRVPFVIKGETLEAGTASTEAPTPLGSATIITKATDPLGKLVLMSLYTDGKVAKEGASFVISKADVGLRDASGVALRGTDGKPLTDTATAEVSEIEIVFDEHGVSKRVRLVGRGTLKVSAKGKAKIEATAQIDMQGPSLSALEFPTAAGLELTLEDIVQFLGGRIRASSGAYVPVEELLKTEAALLIEPPELGKETASKAATMAARVRALADGFGSIHDAREGRLTSQHTLALRELVDATQVFRGCSELATAKLTAANECVGGKATGKGWWPGFAREREREPIRDPLLELELQLVELSDAAAAWNSTEAQALAKALSRELAGSGPAIELEVSLTQQRFFDTYLTEVAGLAMLPYHQGTATSTVGIQLFLYPNEVDEPMWINGRLDLRRVLGLELSMRPSGKAYGYDERFGPLPGSGLPPFFFGPVLQLIPYTTFGTGVAVFGHRRSPLPQERRERRSGWYVSATVQVNLAAIIRRVATGQSPATVTGTSND